VSYPTVVVEFAPTSTPLDETPTWVDITAYVRNEPAIRINRGRPSELQAFSAGTMSLTLDNRARRFDPTFAAGPYFGNLIPGKQIRVRATWNAITYDVFTGWVTGWPQTFGTAGKDATVSIEAFDAIGWMAKNRLPDDILTTFATETGDGVNLGLFLRGIDSYLWLDDTAISDGAVLQYGVRESGSSLMLGSMSPSIVFDGATVWALTTPVTSSTGDWTVAFTMSTTFSDDTNSMDLMGSVNRDGLGLGAIAGSQISMLGTGQIQWRAGILTIDDTVTTTAKVNDGRPHLIVVTGVGSGDSDDVQIFVDGAEAEVVRDAFGSGYGQMSIAFIGDSAATPKTTPTVFTGSIQDVAFWNENLASEANGFGVGLGTLWKYTSGFFEQEAAGHAGLYLDEAGWPSAWQDLSLSGSMKATAGQLIFGGRTVLDAMQELERTEQGRIFATKANTLTVLHRYWTAEETRGTTVQVTFSDDGNDVKYTTFGYGATDLDIVNDLTVTAAQRGQGRAIDVASAGEHGGQSASIDTILTSPVLATSMAQGLVAQRAYPLNRLTPILVTSVPDSLWDNVLGLELGDRIKAEITPMGVSPQVVEELTLEQISWSIDAKQWQLTIIGAPVPPDFFVVASSLVDGTDVIGY
jgi:hypothetical protein